MPQGDVILQETYYSIGGGFVLTAAELADGGRRQTEGAPMCPTRFETAAEMLAMAAASGLSHRADETRQ